VRAQELDYEHAVAELRAGHKRTHWMWYVFPQFDGLGMSPRSVEFAIKSRAEAGAFLDHPILGPRLLECCEAIVGLEDCSITEIFGKFVFWIIKEISTTTGCLFFGFVFWITT
jgi:uncharacterized protein (DUF1810 family)